MEVIDKKPITQVIDSSGTNYIDGRPCFSPDGKTVLFERAGGDIHRAAFWSVAIDKAGTETPYYTSSDYGCFRAAWSWNPDQEKDHIAFTAIHPMGISKIMLLTENGAADSARELIVNGYQANTRLSYPAWYANESSLLISDYNALALVKATTDGEFLGVVSSGTKWAGMGTVSAANSNILAYAGQPVSTNGYNQSVNKIWIQAPGGFPMVFSNKAEATIGRAPWFGPQGKMMAFEARSHGVLGNMQIFIKEIGTYPFNERAIPVSDPLHSSQHAKFSPDGKKMVWAQQTAIGKAQIYMGTIT